MDTYEIKKRVSRDKYNFKRDSFNSKLSKISLTAVLATIKSVVDWTEVGDCSHLRRFCQEVFILNLRRFQVIIVRGRGLLDLDVKPESFLVPWVDKSTVWCTAWPRTSTLIFDTSWFSHIVVEFYTPSRIKYLRVANASCFGSWWRLAKVGSGLNIVVNLASLEVMRIKRNCIEPYTRLLERNPFIGVGIEKLTLYGSSSTYLISPTNCIRCSKWRTLRKIKTLNVR